MTADVSRPKRGVVAVVIRAGRLLVIRRSQHVRAPGMYCFPGGAIEEGETDAAALIRELAEELSLPARAARHLWSNVTPWGVALTWWLADVDESHQACPNPAEVEACHWLTVAEIRRLPDLLPSNLEFLAAWEQGAFVIDGLGPGVISSRDTSG